MNKADEQNGFVCSLEHIKDWGVAKYWKNVRPTHECCDFPPGPTGTGPFTFHIRSRNVREIAGVKYHHPICSSERKTDGDAFPYVYKVGTAHFSRAIQL